MDGWQHPARAHFSPLSRWHCLLLLEVAVSRNDTTRMISNGVKLATDVFSSLFTVQTASKKYENKRARWECRPQLAMFFRIFRSWQVNDNAHIATIALTWREGLDFIVWSHSPVTAHDVLAE